VNISYDLTALRQEIAEQKARVAAATRPAAQAAAQVFYEAARINAPVSEEAHYFYGKGYKKGGKKYGPYQPGNLRNGIYQAFAEKKSGPSKATYRVSVNLQKVPYAAMVELGTSRMPAHSYIGKAFAEQGAKAAEAMRATFISRVRA
jgi:HK97 gp10 family phage protein